MAFVGWMPTSIGIILMTIAQAWLVLVASRLVFGRLNAEFLKNSTRLNLVLALTTFLTIIVFAWIGANWILLVSAISFGVAVALIVQVIWTLRHFKVKSGELTQKPTVSICIPARNEDDALIECIDTALQTDYPKLEILVLDDCSQDKTAQIIKSYAHAGVRFVQGALPADGWLGKNQAMQTLAEHANGEWILFMGVDTHLGEKSVSKLMTQAISTNVEMISVLPQNMFSTGFNTVFGTLQYFWQVVLPIGKRHVPVSSKSWLIKTEALKKLGGFKSVRHKILPEAFFASRLFARNSYRFLISDKELDITAAKKWRSQVRTSVRILYPTFKRQPYYMLFALAAVGVFTLGPFLWPLYLLMDLDFLLLINLITSALLLICYGLVLFRSQPSSWPVAVLCLPIVLVQELIVGLISMLSYEFGEVEWKDRNVCYPVISQGQRSVPLKEELQR